MNLLYTLQENLIIPEDLKGSIGLYELPGEHIRLRSMIGKGAFGEVYIGEAQGVNDNPDWTTVAIKTLAGIDAALLLCNKLITPQSQKHTVVTNPFASRNNCDNNAFRMRLHGLDSMLMTSLLQVVNEPSTYGMIA